jgi:hypothetical protein
LGNFCGAWAKVALDKLIEWSEQGQVFVLFTGFSVRNFVTILRDDWFIDSKHANSFLFEADKLNKDNTIWLNSGCLLTNFGNKKRAFQMNARLPCRKPERLCFPHPALAA